jgi:purine-binding chemotaxis protein CheW
MTTSDQEYLTFMLDGEEFGIDILRVQEIRVWTPVTELPNTPDYLKGVINLRGTIVPIVDLRERFGREALEYNDTTVTIILRAAQNNKQVTVGIVVDAVSEVYKFDERDISPTPELGSSIDSRFLQGMASVKDKLVILLDTQKLLDVDELYQVSTSIKAAS